MFYQIIGHDQTISNVFRRFLVLLGVFSLAACAAEFPKELGIPKYEGPKVSELNIGMIDHREFILNDNKEPWFEGIVRGGFGIPLSLQRPDEPDEQSFAKYLSLRMKEAFEAQGTKVKVIEFVPGTDRPDALKVFLEEGSAALLIEMYHSRYDCCFGAEYRYDFEFFVISKAGEVISSKRFAFWEEEMDLMDTSYNVFGFYAERYAQVFTEFLNDTEIQAALARAEN